MPEVGQSQVRLPPKTIDEGIERLRSLGVKNVSLEPKEKVWGKKASESLALDKIQRVTAEAERLNDLYPGIMTKVDRIYITDVERGHGRFGKTFGTYETEMSIPNEWSSQAEGRRINWETFNGRRWAAGRPNMHGEDGFRHELAHNLTETDIHKDWKLATRKNKFTKQWFRENVSEYASTNPWEQIAESFSIFTQPDYVGGTLPSVLENVLERMLKI